MLQSAFPLILTPFENLVPQLLGVVANCVAFIALVALFALVAFAAFAAFVAFGLVKMPPAYLEISYWVCSILIFVFAVTILWNFKWQQCSNNNNIVNITFFQINDVKDDFNPKTIKNKMK